MNQKQYTDRGTPKKVLQDVEKQNNNSNKLIRRRIQFYEINGY